MSESTDRNDVESDAIRVAASARLAGDQLNSAAAMLPLVYDELRSLAGKRMRSERPDHTLQATALVHEAFHRLAFRGTSWTSVAHFYRSAAVAMQQILIDHARMHHAQKRGGTDVTAKRLPIDISSVADLTVHDDPDRILELDRALEQLKAFDASAAELVRLRFFAGLSIEQTAGVLQIGLTTAKKKWSFARAYLARELSAQER